MSLGQSWAKVGVFRTALLISEPHYDAIKDETDIGPIVEVPTDRGYQLFIETFNQIFPDGMPIGNGTHRVRFDYSLVKVPIPENTTEAEAQDLVEMTLRQQIEDGVHFFFFITAYGGVREIADELQRIIIDCCMEETKDKGHDYFFRMQGRLENDLDSLLNLLTAKVRCLHYLE